MTTNAVMGTAAVMKRSIIHEIVMIAMIVTVLVGIFGPLFTGGGVAAGICLAGSALGVQVFVVAQLYCLADYFFSSPRQVSKWLLAAGKVTLISLGVTSVFVLLSWVSSSPCGCED